MGPLRGRYHRVKQLIDMKGFMFLAVLLTSLLVTDLRAQIVEIDGKTKITRMDTVTTVPANVVRQPNGTLPLRQYKIDLPSEEELNIL